MAKHTLELTDDKRTVHWNIPEIAGQTYTTVHFKVLYIHVVKFIPGHFS